MNLRKKVTRRVATLSLQGERETQQDVIDWVNASADGTNGHLAVIAADGHHIEGDIAAGIAAQTILSGPEFDIQSIRERFLEAHEIIELDKVRGGTTATFVSVCGNKLLAAWCGNSEARLVKRDGHLRTLTIPHEYGVHAKETVRLDQAGAQIEYRSVSGRRGFVATDRAYLEVTRSLGDIEFYPFVLPEPEIREVTLTESDRFVIVGSDGLWQTIGRGAKRHRLEEVLAAARSADDAKQKIADLLSHWRLKDNTSFAIVEI